MNYNNINSGGGGGKKNIHVTFHHGHPEQGACESAILYIKHIINSHLGGVKVHSLVQLCRVLITWRLFPTTFDNNNTHNIWRLLPTVFGCDGTDTIGSSKSTSTCGITSSNNGWDGIGG